MQGKTIVVTGGFGALGSVVAETAAKRGASVALLDYAPTVPAGFAEQLGANTLIVGGVDLTSLTAGETAMASIKAKFGRLDALLNIAGGFQWDTFADGKVDSWDRMYAMNLKTALNACSASLAAENPAYGAVWSSASRSSSTVHPRLRAPRRCVVSCSPILSDNVRMTDQTVSSGFFGSSGR